MSNNNKSILERKVIHKGKTFIFAGDEHARAYIIQQGLIRSYIEKDGQEVEIGQFGPGKIICEVCLMSDEPVEMSYQAMEDTTVASITRAEFQKKISMIDKNIWTILEHVMNKLNRQAKRDIDDAQKFSEIDDDAYKMLKQFTERFPDEQKMSYEKVILPTLNTLVKQIKQVKADISGE